MSSMIISLISNDVEDVNLNTNIPAYPYWIWHSVSAALWRLLHWNRTT